MYSLLVGNNLTPMENTIHALVRYNTWANKRIAVRLSNLSNLVLDFNLHSSFPTIRKTAIHIWDAETIWLNRLQGHSLTEFPSKHYPSDVDPTRFIETSEAFEAFVTQWSDADLDEICAYTNIAGTAFQSTRREIVMHCTNHSTFHRGQLMTMMRTAGVESGFESTDLITYFREI
ncbi:MAG: DinB family protein [Bacteroidia bacterium]